MSRIRAAAAVIGGLGLAGATAAVFAAVGGGAWVWGTSERALTRTWDVHAASFPVPFPLDGDELVALRAERVAAGADAADPLAGLDLAELALERAIDRGEHLVQARYACSECHGVDFGGGKMIDDAMIGRLFAPNLTLGAGSRTLGYTSTDWDRVVRHGVKPDGTGTIMPSSDFAAMSDRELSDIVSYVRSLPPVDAETPPLGYGPVGRALIATGQIELSAATLPDHHAAHVALPPPEAPDAQFGEHLAQVCSGCHKSDFTGGPIVGGDPTWPPAADLTALGEWTYDDFATALRTGKRPDGTALQAPMSDMTKLAVNMSETELRAMWAFLQSLPPSADPNQG